MSIHGIAKGNALEPIAKSLAQAEANGVMMYYALARRAREEGLEEAADAFIEAANQEAAHAGFYATVLGRYPKDFWGLARAIQKAEANAEPQIKAIADQFRAAGHAAAADEIEIFAKEEARHGEMMKKILDKFAPAEELEKNGELHICPVCGYEHVGSMDEEADDYVCPLCGQPKSAFQKKEA